MLPHMWVRRCLTTHLNTVHQALTRQIPIHETRNSPNRIQRKPQHQILRTIPPINRHHLPHLNPKLINQPIPNFRDAIEELAIRPRLAFEDEERVVGLFLKRVVLQDVVGEHALLEYARGEEVGVGFGDAAVAAEVVGDVEFCVEVSCDCGEACGAGKGGRDCMYMSVLHAYTWCLC